MNCLAAGTLVMFYVVKENHQQNQNWEFNSALERDGNDAVDQMYNVYHYQCRSLKWMFSVKGHAYQWC